MPDLDDLSAGAEPAVNELQPVKGEEPQDDIEPDERPMGDAPDPRLAGLLAALSQLKSTSTSDNPVSARSMRIDVAKLALQLLPEGNQRTDILEKLATALYEQSQALNQLNTLDEALDYLAQALEATDVKQDYARLGVLYSG